MQWNEKYANLIANFFSEHSASILASEYFLCSLKLYSEYYKVDKNIRVHEIVIDLLLFF